ncbi:MAG: toll/interleukin-1 receptor domain-containing protein [Rugosibacter sp.]|nr:toll/interleukin-1 receptor domain-containing protein [Rugosibacter sp.]
MNHEIKKPKLFISHATTDGEFANAVKAEIEKVFANGVDVFCTSSPGAIPVGNDWLSDIESKLGSAQAVIAIVTPVSIERPWLWFEIGATWSSGRAGNCKIYPLCVAEIDLSSLPAPLNRLQALSLGKAADLKMLFEALILQFGFGKISSFKASNISSRIPKYQQVEVKDIDLNDRNLYSGKYSGYSNEELMEIIDTLLFHPDYDKASKYATLYQGREELIFNGKLLHFRQLDRSFELPPGTARALVVPVAERYGLVPALLTDNVVRFREEDR